LIRGPPFRPRDSGRHLPGSGWTWRPVSSVDWPTVRVRVGAAPPKSDGRRFFNSGPAQQSGSGKLYLRRAPTGISGLVMAIQRTCGLGAASNHERVPANLSYRRGPGVESLKGRLTGIGWCDNDLPPNPSCQARSGTSVSWLWSNPCGVCTPADRRPFDGLVVALIAPVLLLFQHPLLRDTRRAVGPGPLV
jgi:hypothetical protein